MQTLKFITGLLIWIGIGCVFGSVAYVPALRNRAKQSSFVRQLLTLSLSTVTFIPVFMLFTFFVALMSQVGWYSQEQWAELDRELWVHFMTPEILLANDTCVTDDVNACQLSQRILAGDRDFTGYIMTWIIALIPAISCGFTVRFIKRDDRKRKIELKMSRDVKRQSS